MKGDLPIPLILLVFALVMGALIFAGLALKIGPLAQWLSGEAKEAGAGFISTQIG